MNYKLWFALVAIDAVILIFSFLNGNLIYALISLIIALYLQSKSSKIDFPELTILGHTIKRDND